MVRNVVWFDLQRNVRRHTSCAAGRPRRPSLLGPAQHPIGAAPSAEAPPQQRVADAARAALEAMQNRELLRALAFVRPAGGAEQTAPELPCDDAAQHIEAILMHPGDHAKTLPPLPLQPQPQPAGEGHATPPRLAAPSAAPLLVTPVQVLAAPHSARALEYSP